MSYNEDVEVGRCISRILGVQCTWSYQVREIPHWMNIIKLFQWVFPSIGCKNLLYGL